MIDSNMVKVDEWVLKVQKWLNKNYKSVPKWGEVIESGSTGWDTIYGIIRAIQYELDIKSFANNFGAQTQAEWDAKVPRILVDGSKNRIIQLIDCGMICKGMGSLGFSESWKESTQDAIIEFKESAGFTNSNFTLSAMWAKALFDMSAFRIVSGGSQKVQEVQKYLNRKYYKYTGILPCDGIYQRDTNKALIFGLQAEMGMKVGEANGFFGVGTTNGCPTLTASQGSTENIRILQGALIVNDEYSGPFDGVWNASVSTAVRTFKDFMKIQPINEKADMPVIKALLTTTGDTNRETNACDTSYQILTQGQVDVLKKEGYNTIGRYLTGTVGFGSTERRKNLTINELKLLQKNNFSVFPIYQDGGTSINYFARSAQGISDAKQAGAAAKSLGFKQGTKIYFACDFDVMGHEIPIIIHYMREVVDTMRFEYPQFSVSIYAPRNVCTQVMNANVQIRNCFVSDMSSGFSANLGYKMPRYWTFDQFYEYSTSGLDIDKVAMSGFLDTGETSFDFPSEDESLLALKSAAQTKIARKIVGDLSLFKDTVQVGFGSEVEHEAVLGNVQVTLKISNNINVFDGGIISYDIVNGKPSLEFQNEFKLVQDLIDLSGSESILSEMVSKLSVTINDGKIQFRPTLSDRGAVGVEIITKGSDFVISPNDEKVNYEYSLVLGIYFNPMYLPEGLHPEVDKYKVEYKEFEKKLKAATIGTGILGLVVIGGYAAAGVGVTTGIVKGISAVLAGILAFLKQPFKN